MHFSKLLQHKWKFAVYFHFTARTHTRTKCVRVCRGAQNLLKCHSTFSLSHFKSEMIQLIKCIYETSQRMEDKESTQMEDGDEVVSEQLWCNLSQLFISENKINELRLHAKSNAKTIF